LPENKNGEVKMKKKSTKAVSKANADVPMVGSDRAELIAECYSLMRQAVGVSNDDVALAIVLDFEQMLGKTESRESLALAANFLREFQPTSAHEAMLAVQMFGVHQASLRFLGNATLKEQTPEGRDSNVLRASRLMRLFRDQLDTMAMLKGKAGQQRMTVDVHKHIHLHPTGQASTGEVSPSARALKAPGGGGVR
jgi:hypothetical protein